MPAVLNGSLNVVEWLGLRLELPRPWEIVRHGVSSRKGSLAFADRRRQRLQVTWTSCVKRPDVGRLLSDHRARQQVIDTDAVFATPTLPPGWRGLERRFGPALDADRSEAATLVRAAHYHAETARLIEVVVDVDPYDPADATLAADVLGGLRVVGRAEEARRVRAFGIEAGLPTGWRMHRAVVQPADAALTFVPRDTPRVADPQRPLPKSVTLRRRAMADAWFDGDWRALFKRDESKAVFSIEPHDTDESPRHDAASVAWDVPGPRYQRLLNRHQVAVSRAWRCPAEDAIYQVTAVGPAKDAPSLDGFALACGGPAEGRCAVG